MFYGFSQTTFAIGFSLFARTADVARVASAPIENLRIGVTAAGFPRIHFSRHHPQAELLVVKDSVEGLRRLLRGDIDAFAAATWTGNYYLRELNISGVMPVGKPFVTLDTAIAVPLGNPALLADIDRALSQIKADGSFDLIVDQWAGERMHVISTQEIWRIGQVLVALATIAVLAVIAIAGRAKRQALLRRIAEQAQAKEAIRESERFARSIADNLPGMVGYWTADLRCAFANRNYEKWFGKPAAEIVGMRIQDFLGQALFRQNEPYIRGALRGEPQQFERTLIKSDGESGHIRAQYIPDCKDGEVRGFLVLVSDFTEFKRVQQKLEAANADLQEKTRLAEAANEAKTRFLAGVSHELRTPLHTLLGFVRLVRQETSGEVRNQLTIAARNGIQLMRLIDDLIEFNRGTGQALRLHAEPVSLREIFEQVEHSSRLMAADQGNTYISAIADGLPAGIIVDERRLLQILQNLIGNACKYTRGGTVILRVEHVNNATHSGTCRLRFAVEDNGSGITAGDLPHIFNAFARGAASHRQPGLGLGLTIAQQWVGAMGGEIQVSSEPDRGSCFHFTLSFPLAEVEVPVLPAQITGSHEAEGQSVTTAHTVLVVDDIADSRLLLRHMCEGWGFRVIEASDGDEALQACVTTEPAIDAVLVDQFMPRMNGWEFLRHARALPTIAPLPIVLISASEAHRPTDFPPDVEFDLMLYKPLDERLLARFLRENIHGELLPEDGDALDGYEEILNIPLPSSEVKLFLEMLDLGRVEAIAIWAQQMANTDQHFTHFAECVVRLCHTANLAALENIADTLRSPQQGSM